MDYFQEPYLMDQGFQDEAYFTNFPTDDETKCFNPWPTMPLETQQLGQPDLYPMRSNYSDASSYVSPYLDALESPFADTIGPMDLLQADDSQSPLPQTYQSPSPVSPSFFPAKLSNSDYAQPLSSPNLADSEAPNRTTSTTTKRSSTRRSEAASLTSKPLPPKRGRPRKKRTATNTTTSASPSTSSESDSTAILRAKHAHSVIERRYRDNLNGKMMQLHRILVAVEEKSPMSLGQYSNDQTVDGDMKSPAFPDQQTVFGQAQRQRQQSTTGARVRKSDIMSRAIAYIQQSEAELRHLRGEVGRLRGRERERERDWDWECQGQEQQPGGFAKYVR